MRRGFAAVLFAVLAAFTFADRWCFVVAGDGRTNDQTPDPTGINVPVMKHLVAAMSADHPRFLLFTGDLMHGVYGKVTAPVDQQLATWKQVMSGMGGIPILPVRGNHETFGDKDGANWLRLIKPMMDSARVNYFAGEEGFSFNYVPAGDRKMMVIAVDQFIHEHKVDLAGLEKALKSAKAASVKNIFVFAHEMAFTCTSHGDGENMAKFKDDRNKFLDLLQHYGVRYFFAGHDHAYDWMVIRSPKWPAGYALNQIVAGTAGAPFYTDKGYFGDHDGYDLVRKEHKDSTYGYMLVQVDDKEGITITFKEVKGQVSGSPFQPPATQTTEKPTALAALWTTAPLLLMIVRS